MKDALGILAALLAGCATAFAGDPSARSPREIEAGATVLDWESLPPLPDRHGFAGMFAGTSGRALIVAGGANFPGGRPWNGAEKVWHDDIFVLAEPRAAWQTGAKLPRALGYGVSVTTEKGVICLGGGDAQQHYADVFRLQWAAGEIRITELPPMPGPTAFFCGAVVGETIYVAGGKDWPVPRHAEGSSEPRPPVAMRTFWALDLSKELGQQRWERLEPWPGLARMQAVAAVQEDCFFLIGGVALEETKPGDDKRVFLTDGYRYDPKQRTWTPIAEMPWPAAAAPTPAMPLGQAHFAIVGGDNGLNALRVAELKDDHPGFPATILCYHTITDTWVTRGEFPRDLDADVWPPVTTNTTAWRGRYVVPSGEARPGVRTVNVLWAEPVDRPQGFASADYAVLAVYLGALVAMGVYFSRREKSTADFFLGGRRIPWWAAGMSIFGTQLSAITFMAIPAKAYHTNWVYFLGQLMILAVAPVVVFVYLPLLRRLDVTTAYEYLELRFNLATRLVGSAAFILFQLGRMGVVLYLPAAALSTVTGMNVYFCIALMGTLATVYTVLGGIEAVIWTDVLQVVVLLGGALLALVIIASEIDGGLAGIAAQGLTHDKLRMANLNWDITTAAVWVVLLGKPFEVLVSYTADQTVVQRYLTTADRKGAAWGIWTNALLTIPASIIFFGVGTALWAFYRMHPAMLNPTGKIDDVFPWFIAQQLPVGVAGLVLAGLFAAAMSSLDSSMNSMATVVTTDFYRRANPEVSDLRCLRLARWLTVLLGAVGTAFALYMAWLQSTSMWDQYSKIIGLFGGGLAGLFAVGIFTRRATATGALLGFLGSAVVLYAVKSFTDVHFFLYPTIGMGSCFVIGYTASRLIPSAQTNGAASNGRPDAS